MAGFFYQLGRKVAPKVRKARWMWASATAPESEVTAAERAVGADLAQGVYQQVRRCEDEALAGEVRQIGELLAQRVKNKLLKFDFACLELPEPQAFCLPGGFVFISRGMVNLCGRNRDKIAFILGHEMAHVIGADVMDRMLSRSVIGAVSRATRLRQVPGALQKLGVQFLECAYSQDQEQRADELGVRLAMAAGFDGTAAAALMDQLEANEQVPVLGPYFSTHPRCKARAAHLKRIVEEKRSRD